MRVLKSLIAEYEFHPSSLSEISGNIKVTPCQPWPHHPIPGISQFLPKGCSAPLCTGSIDRCNHIILANTIGKFKREEELTDKLTSATINVIAPTLIWMGEREMITSWRELNSI